ncbi:MAG: GNAT family N-acetyltransferase [Patescibacteria group bacterium]
MVTIRLAKKEDLPILAAIYTKVYDVVRIGEKWTAKAAENMLESYLHKQPDLAFLAEWEGTIVGGFFSGIKPLYDGNHLFDGDAFIHPDYQHKGIGKALFKRMFKEALEKYNAKTFSAFTYNGSDFPMNWYKKLGFREITKWTIFSGDIPGALKKLDNDA